MTRERAVEILENMPEDIYTLDGIFPTKVESWSLARLHKQFIYKDDNQNISIDCIVDWRESTFNLVHVIHKPKQELPSIYSKVGEKMVAYFTLFGLKRDFYL